MGMGGGGSVWPVFIQEYICEQYLCFIVLHVHASHDYINMNEADSNDWTLKLQCIDDS